jgi:hypothetical protein
MHFCLSPAPAVIVISSDFYRSSEDLQVTMAPGKTSDTKEHSKDYFLSF